MALHLVGTFTAPQFDPTALFPSAPRSAGIVTIRIYYEESDKQFRIQVYPYFERKTGQKLQMYPKQIKISYHVLEAAKRASQTYVEANIRKVFGKHYPGKVEWAMTRHVCQKLNRGVASNRIFVTSQWRRFQSVLIGYSSEL